MLFCYCNLFLLFFYNRSLPENLRWINVFQFRDNWLNCRKYVSKVVPDIIHSNKKENNEKSTNNNSESKEILNMQFKQQSSINRTNSKYRRSIKNGRCYICKKYGHYASECTKKGNHFRTNKNKYKKFKLRKRFNNYKQQKTKYNYRRNHTKNQLLMTTQENNKNLYQDAFTQDYSSQLENPTLLLTNAIDNKNSISTWIIDSGASVHITWQKSLLNKIKPHSEPITFANGNRIYSTHKGDLHGYINDEEINLKNVLYIPNLKRNIISVTKLIEENYKIVFNNTNNRSHALIYTLLGKRITSIPADENNNTYQLWISTSKSNLTNHNQYIENYIYSIDTSNDLKSEIWHKRLAHFNVNQILNKLPNININNKCKICAKSKLSNKPYYQSNSRANEPFDLIHIDLIGPITESLNGNKYVLTILDDHTRYNWIKFLKNKSDAFQQFEYWLNHIINQFKTTPKIIRSDNGTEFLSNNFYNLLNQYGIIHQTTVPYNPQQNGRAERLNGILIRTATTLLEGAKLSRKFWEHAFDTASYIYNRIPHRPINNKIPFELLTKQKVNYNNIRTFGCKVLFLTPKNQKRKLDNSASPGIFIGYCPNPTAYKIFDIAKNKIIISRVVEFYEDDPADFYYSKQLNDTDDKPNDNELEILKLYSNINDYGYLRNKNSTSRSTHDNYNQYKRNYDENESYSLNHKNKNINQLSYNISNISNDRNFYIPEHHNKIRLIEPTTYDDVLNSPDKEEWLNAIGEERRNFIRLKVYTPIEELPENANLISCRWIFKYKRDAMGNIVKRKARLVARGFTQQLGIDYQNTFSLTLRQDSLRTITAIAAQNGFNIAQIDVNAAYLNAELDEELYTKIPQGFSDKEGKFWKLNKAIYGLKQSGRAWNNKLNTVLNQIGFKRLQCDPCVYKKNQQTK